MRAVQPDVAEHGQPALDHAAVEQPELAQRAIGVVVGQRDQCPEVAVGKALAGIRLAAGQHLGQQLDQVARLLVGHLGGGRQRRALAGQGVAGAVAHGVDVGVGGLQIVVHDQLVAARDGQAQLGQETGCLHAGGPDAEPGGNDLVAIQQQAVGQRRLHLAVDQHAHAQVFQALLGGLGDLLGEAGQDARPGLDQHDAELGGPPQRAIGFGAFGQLHQLGRQLHAGGAGADDGHLQGLALGHAAHHAQADFAVEVVGLAARIDHVAMLQHAGRAEVVGPAADGDDQLVVADAARGHHFAPVGGTDGGQDDFLACAVQAFHGAGLVGEAGVRGLGQVGGLLLRQVARAGGNGVQHGLPDVGGIGIDQGHRGGVRVAQLAQCRGDFQPRDPATHDHDPCGLVLLRFTHCCFLPVLSNVVEAARMHPACAAKRAFC